MRGHMRCLGVRGRMAAVVAAALFAMAIGKPAMADPDQVLCGNNPTGESMQADSQVDVGPIHYIDAKDECQEVSASTCTDISKPSFKDKETLLGSGWYVMREGRDFGDELDMRAVRAKAGAATYLTITGDVSMVVAPERFNALESIIKVNEGATLKLYALSTAEGASQGVDDDSEKHNPVVIENHGAVEISGDEDVVYHLGVECMDGSSFFMHSGRIDGAVNDNGQTLVIHKGVSAKVYGGSIAQCTTETTVHVQGAPVIDCVKGSKDCVPLITCDGPFDQGASIGVDFSETGAITEKYGVCNGSDASAFIHASDDTPLVLDCNKELRYDAYVVAGENGVERVKKSAVTDISADSFKDRPDYSLGDGWYVIRRSREFKNRLVIKGDAKIIIGDGETAEFKQGICTRSGKLTICAETEGKNPGKLVATAAEESENAGIGSDDNASNQADIVICGGKIEARGGKFSAGIGGGDHGGCGRIKILGGNVSAYGGGGATIVDGGGAGIGSGDAAESGGTVEICGGVVNAESVAYGAGIGTGDEAKHCVDITISGGNVTATGGERAAGIGGGNESKANVKITGGKVNATGGDYGAGIGTGDECGFGAAIEIWGGNVTANAGCKAAGIGGGNETSGGTIEVYGGTVKAHAPKVSADLLFELITVDGGGAGIGGGDEGDSGNITINGGDVTAEAECNGALAIGHGKEGLNKDILLGECTTVIGKSGERRTGGDRYSAVNNWRWARLVTEQ